MTSSSKTIDNTHGPLNKECVRRVVNDSSVALGCLYDMKSEQIVGKLSLDQKAVMTVTQQKDPECLVMKSDSSPSEDVYRMIEIHDEPWLNLVLNIVPARKMNAIVHYSPDMTANSRYLYFNQCSYEQTFSLLRAVVADNIQKTMPDIDATHVVSTIRVGVQVLVVLHLPADGDENQFDQLLESTRQQLLEHKYESSTTKKSSLDRIEVVKIFSNVPCLEQKSTLSDLCQRISDISRNKHCHYPIRFNLRSIHCFYPHYPAERMIYSPLNQYNISLLKQYLISLSSNIKELEITLNTKEKLVTNERLKGQFQALQERITDVKEMHLDELESIRSSVMEIRVGKIHQNSIREMLENPSKQSCQNAVRSLLEEIRVFEDKPQYTTTYHNEDRKEHVKKGRNPSEVLQAEQKTSVKKQLSNREVKLDGRILEALPKEQSRSASSPLPDMNYINVLLLGESGVGKSTFISAFANYYTFRTFDEAHSRKPFVVLPVSFLMTTGDTFEEKVVRFGEIDLIEDHGHCGQSVTQHCRSYVLPISDRTKLRLIDTPDMGNTQGLEQDDLNIKHILLYISNLSHLNAICILLKPNESRLTIVLRSYFTRLLNFVGANARDNIIFCFTNARSTFYAPGDTGPLLREMINSLPTKGIKFEKANTFCFDSEAFRYLIAVKNGIHFDNDRQERYQRTWTRSSKTASSLIKYICSDLQPYSQNKWQSIEHVEFQAKQLVRPLLETARNTLRNISLVKRNSPELIRLHPQVTLQSATICYKCPRQPRSIANIWIYPDDLHAFASQCDQCQCDGSKHTPVDYKLQYNLIVYDNKLTLREINDSFKRLRMGILQCAEIYGYLVGILKQNDPLLSALRRIVAEEETICSRKGTDCLNSTIRNELKSLMNDYIEERTKVISIGIPVDLSKFILVIESISENEELNEQIKAIKKAQENYIKQHEKEVSLISDHANHQRFSKR